MATTQTSGFDRFNEALRSLDDQLRELREAVDDRAGQLRKDLRQRADDLEGQLRKNPLFKRAERARKDIEGEVDRRRAQVLEAFGLASKADIDKLNRRLNAISKRVNELAREQRIEV